MNLGSIGLGGFQNSATGGTQQQVDSIRQQIEQMEVQQKEQMAELLGKDMVKGDDTVFSQEVNSGSTAPSSGLGGLMEALQSNFESPESSAQSETGSFSKGLLGSLDSLLGSSGKSTKSAKSKAGGSTSVSSSKSEAGGSKSASASKSSAGGSKSSSSKSSESKSGPR